jgi:MSHA pilin protein MshC
VAAYAYMALFERNSGLAERRTPVRCHRGFTLVELVVTLVIIGALAAASAPLFFSTQDFQRSGFRNEALAGIRYAQKLAVGSGCGVQVAVAANTITLTTAAAAGACFSGPFNQPALNPSNPVAGVSFSSAPPNGSGIAVTSTLSPFLFCPLGDVSSSGNCDPNYAHVDVTVSITGQPNIFIVGATGYTR